MLCMHACMYVCVTLMWAVLFIYLFILCLLLDIPEAGKSDEIPMTLAKRCHGGILHAQGIYLPRWRYFLGLFGRAPRRKV